MFKVLIPAILVVGGVITYLSAFIVDTRNQAIQVCLGEISRSINAAPLNDKELAARKEVLAKKGEVKKVSTSIEIPNAGKPGLYFMYPFICQALKMEKLTMTLEGKAEQISAGAEKDYVDISYFAMWRIVDPVQYYLSYRGNDGRAISQIQNYIKDAFQEALQVRSVTDVVSTSRVSIMKEVKDSVIFKVNQNKLGLTIMDVRINQVELKAEIQKAIFEQMKREREKIAVTTISNGKKKARKIKAEGDREQRTIVASADRKSKELRGAGDATATRIYALAFGRNKAFYEFYKSLEAYKISFNDGDTMVLEPSSEFFKYFNSSNISP